MEVEKITLISDPSVLNLEKDMSLKPTLKENEIEKKITSIQENQEPTDKGTTKQSVH